MKLTSITFTGIDERTNLDRLESIQQKYPYAEFGVLMSEDWIYNGERFPNPDTILERLEGRKLQLSVHLCGRLALSAAIGNMNKLLTMTKERHKVFRRCQLNLRANGLFEELRIPWQMLDFEEVIIQMHTPELCEEFLRGKVPEKRSFLLDASGGAGIDTPIEIVTSPGIHIGYAGGISPSNVESKLRPLLAYDSEEKFWIDMETKVRTVAADKGEWLDLDKVEKVLEICDPIIKEFNQ